MEQSFVLSADPRSAEAGITEADIIAHEALALQISELLSDARRASQEVSKRLKVADLDADEKAQLEEIKTSLETAKGTYMKPKLIDQISYLYGTVSGSADFMPGKDAYDRYDELKIQLEQIRDSIGD